MSLIYKIFKLKTKSWIKNWIYNQEKAPTPILPTEYQQVDYIQSSGTQYIDTGYKINPYRNKIEFEFAITSDTGYQGLIGTRPTTGYSEYSYNILYNAVSFENKIRLDLLIATAGFQESSNITLNQKYKIINKNKQCYVDNTLYTSNTNKEDNIINYNFYLFNFNNAGNPYIRNNQTSGLIGKMYYFKIYDDNDNIVVNMIPCYRKSDNVVGMYDIVRNTFYTNAGTGEFGKGDDV